MVQDGSIRRTSGDAGSIPAATHREWLGPLAAILILLIPTFLLGGCASVFGKPWAKVTTLSEALARESKHSVDARYYRIDSLTASVVFTSRYGDRTTFRFHWPVEWGVLIVGESIRTETGDDPRVISEKYVGSF